MVDKKKKSNVTPLFTAITGVFIGAGVAVVGAILNKKENREQIKKVISDVKDQASEYLDNAQDKAEEKQKVIKQKIDEGTDKIEEIKKVVQN